MLQKKNVWYFSIMFVPMFIISMLINVVYSLNAHDYLQINWLSVIILAIILDVLMTWSDVKKKEEKKPE